MKYTITENQKRQFNLMRLTLLKIARHYQTVEQLKIHSKREYGLDFEEALEMAYENLQNDAAHAVKGVQEII